MDRTFYVTTPIYYVNAEPHIGHAYSTIVADTLSRFYRAQGYETRFQTGTDEHGEKVVQAALKEGKDPQPYVDRISQLFRQTWPELTIQPDHFIRPRSEHMAVVAAILSRVHDSGTFISANTRGNIVSAASVLQKPNRRRTLSDHQTFDVHQGS
jgi:methionyl-tRNA synthetase